MPGIAGGSGTRERWHAVEPVRVVLALCIVTLHLKWEFLPHAYLAVEFFFVLSGFLLASTPPATNQDLLRARIARTFWSVFPLYLVSVALSVAFKAPAFPPLADQLFAYAMLQSLGLNDAVINSPSWFLVCWFWASITIQATRTFASTVTFILIAATVTIVGYASLHGGTESTGLNYSFEARIGPLTVGIIRAFAGLCAGVCTHALLNWIRRLELNRAMATIIEVMVLALVVYLFSVRLPTPRNDFAFVLLACGALTLLIIQRGWLSHALYLAGKSGGLAWAETSVFLFLFHYPVLTVFERLLGERAEWEGINLAFIWCSVVVTAYLVGFLSSQIIRYLQTRSEWP
ncbi:acyltransferase family protein [Devosia submarina]|uniref:acyltransferase family protein n=1 Tax=Devosia submarina TaxID=1173082 RepID=UPI000D3BFC4C